MGKGYVLLWQRLIQTTRWTCPQFLSTYCWRATCFHPPSPGLHVQWTDSGDGDHPVVRARNLLKQNDKSTNTITVHRKTSTVCINLGVMGRVKTANHGLFIKYTVHHCYIGLIVIIEEIPLPRASQLAKTPFQTRDCHDDQPWQSKSFPTYFSPPLLIKSKTPYSTLKAKPLVTMIYKTNAVVSNKIIARQWMSNALDDRLCCLFLTWLRKKYITMHSTYGKYKSWKPEFCWLR